MDQETNDLGNETSTRWDETRAFNATTERWSEEEDCSEPEVNASSVSLTSSDGGGGNCTSPSGGVYTAHLLAERRYDVAVTCCVIVAATVCLNAILLNRLLGRAGGGGRLAAGVARSSLLLNLVVGDWLEAGGGCGVLAVALIGGRWPFGDVGCVVYRALTTLGHVMSYYTLAGVVVER